MASTAYRLSLRKFKCFNVHRVFGRDTRSSHAARLLFSLGCSGPHLSSGVGHRAWPHLWPHGVRCRYGARSVHGRTHCRQRLAWQVERKFAASGGSVWLELGVAAKGAASLAGLHAVRAIYVAAYPGTQFREDDALSQLYGGDLSDRQSWPKLECWPWIGFSVRIR